MRLPSRGAVGIRAVADVQQAVRRNIQISKNLLQ